MLGRLSKNATSQYLSSFRWQQVQGNGCWDRWLSALSYSQWHWEQKWKLGEHAQLDALLFVYSLSRAVDFGSEARCLQLLFSWQPQGNTRLVSTDLRLLRSSVKSRQLTPSQRRACRKRQWSRMCKVARQCIRDCRSWAAEDQLDLSRVITVIFTRKPWVYSCGPGYACEAGLLRE